MLDNLTARLTGIFDRLRGYGRLTEENIQEALREVRVALLEADVNFKVVKGFIGRVRVKAVGQDVLTSLTPGQQVVKVVRDELVELLGGSGHRLAMASHPPTVIMLVGLQGSGKTTSAAKLARHFQKQGQHPILASADVYRPAAMEQLRRLGKDLGIPVLGEETQKPAAICRAARDEAAQRGLSPLILDTAGRLHIDEEMLDELRVIKKDVAPHHVLLVVDAMSGQDGMLSLLLEMSRELGGRGGLARALKSDQHDHGRWVWRHGEPVTRAAQQFHQLVAHHLDHLLPRRERCKDVLAHGLDADAPDEALDDLEVDVGLEESHAHFAQGLLDILIRQPAVATEQVEDAGEARGEVVEHGVALK